MKHLRILALVLAAVLVCSFCVGCGSNSQSASNSTQASGNSGSASEDQSAETRDPIKLTLAHYQSTDAMFDIVINEWTQMITEASDGLITFEIYGGGALGAAADHYDMVRSGTCDIAFSFYGIHTGVFKSLETFALPMLGFETGEQASEAMWDFAENYDFSTKELSQVHTLLIASSDPLIIGSAGYKVETAADLKGAALRVAGGPINNFFVALGASTATVAIGQIYENMQKGIMNGYVGGLDSMIGYNLLELCDHVMSTGIQVGPFYLWMNSTTWDNLPQWAKDIFGEYSGAWGSAYFGRRADEIDADGVDTIVAAGIEFNELSDEEYANWEAVAQEIATEWINELNDAGYDGQTIYDTVIALRDKYA